MSVLRGALLFLALSGIGAGTYVYMTDASRQMPVDPLKNKSVSVRVAKVVKNDRPVSVQAVGIVTANQTVALKARVDSEIAEVRFHDGDYVKKDDVLFVLDDRAIKDQLEQAKGILAKDEAQLESTKKKWERAQKLITSKAMSQEAFDDAKAAFDSQSATVASDKANVGALQTQLDYTRIKAPIDGRTGVINVTVGNLVKANDTQPLATLNQIKPITVQASIPQNMLGDVRQAVATGDVPAKASQNKIEALGKLSLIDNAIDETSGTFIVRATFDNEDEKLWPGMLTRLRLDLSTDKDALAVPEIAIQTAPTGTFVYVIEGDVAHRRTVLVRRIQDDWAVLDDGLKESDQVVVDGVMDLKDGSKVKVMADSTETKQVETK